MDQDEEILTRLCHIEYYDRVQDGRTVEGFVEEIIELFRLHDMEILFMGDGPFDEEDDEPSWDDLI